MSRRRFIRKTSLLLQAGLLSSLFPGLSGGVRASDPNDEGLHYRPLNGNSLKNIARNKKHHGKDRFVNPMGIPRNGRFHQLLSWKLFHKNSFESHLTSQPFRPFSIDWENIRHRKGASVTFLKHAGILIKDEKHYTLIDPVFSDIFWFIKDFTPIENIQAMPPPDQVLITHGHYDHLDTVSLSTLDKKTLLISPLGYSSIFEELGMKNHMSLDWYDSISNKNQEITLLPCNHWTMRNPIEGPNRSLWGSYLVRTSTGANIYISGDTAYFDGFSEIGSDYPIDLAIFNLGAYEPRWFMAPSHANPSEIVSAFQEIKAKKLMIVHWGTFRLGDEPVHFPPLDIRKEMNKKGLMGSLVEISHGQTYTLS